MFLAKLSRNSILTAGLILLLLGGCAMDDTFIFFPTTDLVTTPASVGLEYQDVYFTAADGTGLHGWLMPGREKEPYVILFFHGNAGNISHRIHNLRLLYEQLGATIFIIDYRGYGNSTGKPSEEGSYSDARGALAWLHTQGWRQDRIIYFGRSLGAGVALQLAIEEPPAGLVLESAFTSVADMGRKHNPILHSLFGWLLKSRYDNLAKIEQLDAPLLLLHGTRDTIVPPDMSEQLFARAGGAKTLHLIHGADHNDTLAHRQNEYWQTWRTFVGSLTDGKTDDP